MDDNNCSLHIFGQLVSSPISANEIAAGHYVILSLYLTL